MRKVNSLTGQGGILICLVTFLTTGCCHYPKGRVARPIGLSPQVATLTVVAYGDTRTGPWGLGDNAGQAIHGRVVDDIFAHNGTIDAVIFTGDAVMSNFPLWNKAYWKCFLSQTNRFRALGIPFYPSLGNHEVLPPVVPLLKTTAPASTGLTTQPTRTEQDLESRVAEAYEAGEEPTTSRVQLEAAAVAEQVDVNSRQGRALLKQWQRGIGKKDPVSANKFGQFERHLQTSFYNLSADTRCEADARSFNDDYLTKAKYQYLRAIVRGRSYYSKVLEKRGVRLKLIALDTNCLDSQMQQKFFADEVKNSDAPIVVFGHHPPVDYDHPSPWPWDMVPDWKLFGNYLTHTDGQKIALWIFGHVHDYQRRDSTGESEQPTSPVLLIAGGGGASLDKKPSSFQWQPKSWPQPFHVPAYHQIKLSVTASGVAVEVRGAANKSEAFHRIDSFSIPLAKNASN